MASDVTAKSNEPPRRIPKLAVRNRIPENEPIASSSTDEPVLVSRFSVASSAYEPPLASPPPKSSFASEAGPLLSGSSNTTNSKASTASSKKNKVFSFLKLQEPSTKAWAEFAEAEKAKAKEVGRILPDQKLPEHVPKVNSKWDGLPESARQRYELEKAKKNGMISSTSRAGTSYSNKSEWAEESGLPFALHAKSIASQDDGNQSLYTLESQRAGYAQLEPLPELPTIPSETVLGQDNPTQVSELDAASPNVAIAAKESPRIPSGELDETLPGLLDTEELERTSSVEEEASVEEGEEPAPGIPRRSSKRPKVPINFSRPLRKTTEDSIGYPTTERTSNT